MGEARGEWSLSIRASLSGDAMTRPPTTSPYTGLSIDDHEISADAGALGLSAETSCCVVRAGCSTRRRHCGVGPATRTRHPSAARGRAARQRSDTTGRARLGNGLWPYPDADQPQDVGVNRGRFVLALCARDRAADSAIGLRTSSSFWAGLKQG